MWQDTEGASLVLQRAFILNVSSLVVLLLVAIIQACVCIRIYEENPEANRE